MTSQAAQGSVTGAPKPGAGRVGCAVDLGPVLENLDGDRTVAAELVSCLLSTLPGDLRELVEAAAENDPDRVWRVAHRLKGGLLNLGAGGAGELAYALERKARGGTLEGVRELVGELEAELQLVGTELSAWLEEES